MDTHGHDIADTEMVRRRLAAASLASTRTFGHDIADSEVCRRQPAAWRSVATQLQRNTTASTHGHVDIAARRPVATRLGVQKRRPTCVETRLFRLAITTLRLDCLRPETILRVEHAM
jgi:hypothetical protein